MNADPDLVFSATAACRALMLSGAVAIVFSCTVGYAMLWMLKKMNDTPGQPPRVNLRQIGAAHLDWIMLALMLGFVTLFIRVFEIVQLPAWVVYAFIIGAWVNPLSYVFRAFGVNAFVFAGSALQKVSAALGGVSTALVMAGWAGVLHAAWRTGAQ